MSRKKLCKTLVFIMCIAAIMLSPKMFDIGFDVYINSHYIGVIKEIGYAEQIAIAAEIDDITEKYIKVIPKGKYSDKKTIENNILMAGGAMENAVKCCINDSIVFYLEDANKLEDAIQSYLSSYTQNDSAALDAEVTTRYVMVNNDNLSSTEQIVDLLCKNAVPVDLSECIAPENEENKFIYPVNAPVTSGFGERWGKVHHGIDFGANSGDAIKASADGRVEFSGQQDGYGNIIIINHHNGYKTYYAHCNRLYVSEGCDLSAGDVIAEVGNTGRSTGPHLHFEIRLDGQPIDALTLLK